MVKQTLYIFYVLGSAIALFLTALGFFTVTIGLSNLISLILSIFVLFIYAYFIDLALEEV